MTAHLFGLLGIGFAAGLLLIWHGSGQAEPARHDRESRLKVVTSAVARRHGLRGLMVATVGGAGVGIATGWAVGAVLTALAVIGLPSLLGRDGNLHAYLARIDGIAAWTEQLRDTLVAAAGLEQAILATAPIAPEAIAIEIAECAARIDRGEKLSTALRHLADQLEDPTADLVIAALVVAADHQARQLAELLGELAAEARVQAAMRLRVEAQRARSRTSVRVVVITTLVFAGGLVVLNRPYLAPYDSSIGQLMLAAVGALFTAAFLWLGRISRLRPAERVLTELGAITDRGHREVRS